MISQESTTKDVKLVGYDFRGHTRGTLVVGIAYGYPYCKGSAIFSLVYFKYHKWKIVYSLETLCRCASPKALSSSAKSLVQLGNNFVREAEGCRWELKARNSAVQLCAFYDSSCRVGGWSGHLTASESRYDFPEVDHEGRRTCWLSTEL